MDSYDLHWIEEDYSTPVYSEWRINLSKTAQQQEVEGDVC